MACDTPYSCAPETRVPQDTETVVVVVVTAAVVVVVVTIASDVVVVVAMFTCIHLKSTKDTSNVYTSTMAAAVVVVVVTSGLSSCSHINSVNVPSHPTAYGDNVVDVVVVVGGRGGKLGSLVVVVVVNAGFCVVVVVIATVVVVVVIDGLSSCWHVNVMYVPENNVSEYTGNDGKKYSAIAINQLYWIQQNLMETKFRDDSIIPWYGANPANYFTNAEWSALTTAGCCAYNNTLSNVATGFTFPT